jgi:hypothetical protein
MELSHFRERLSALGADLGQWPVQEADAAVALMAVSDEAVSLFAEISGLDLEAQDETALIDAVLDRARRP